MEISGIAMDGAGEAARALMHRSLLAEPARNWTLGGHLPVVRSMEFSRLSDPTGSKETWGRVRNNFDP